MRVLSAQEGQGFLDALKLELRNASVNDQLNEMAACEYLTPQGNVLVVPTVEFPAPPRHPLGIQNW